MHRAVAAADRKAFADRVCHESLRVAYGLLQLLALRQTSHDRRGKRAAGAVLV